MIQAVMSPPPTHTLLPRFWQAGRGLPGPGEEPAGTACGGAEVLRRGQQLHLGGHVGGHLGGIPDTTTPVYQYH